MSRFTSAQRDEILAEARANLAKRNPSSRQPELVYKARDNGAVPSERRTSTAAASGSSELPWWQWVDERIARSLEAHGEEIGTAIGDFCGPQFAALKRQIQLLERDGRAGTPGPHPLCQDSW